ncbi:hypothetical protein D3C85_761070 [compost metagenome]
MFDERTLPTGRLACNKFFPNGGTNQITNEAIGAQASLNVAHSKAPLVRTDRRRKRLNRKANLKFLCLSGEILLSRENLLCSGGITRMGPPKKMGGNDNLKRDLQAK